VPWAGQPTGCYGYYEADLAYQHVLQQKSSMVTPEIN
jgi:hypothetical protein